MQGGFYPYTNVAYPPQGLVSLGGGSTFFSNEGSAVYLRHHQYRDSEKVRALVNVAHLRCSNLNWPGTQAYYTSFLHFPGYSALHYGPGINGYGIPYHGCLQPPVRVLSQSTRACSTHVMM